jgi:hypothetical protein
MVERAIGFRLSAGMAAETCRAPLWNLGASMQGIPVKRSLERGERAGYARLDPLDPLL